MPYKYILLVVAFYFISVMQSSFLPHFSILGVTPNLLLVLVCLFIFLDNAHSYLGIVSAVSAGVFLDLLGGPFLGVSIFAMLFVYFFIKKVLAHLVDFSKEYSILYFIPMLTLCTIFYAFIINFFICLFSWSISLSFNGWAILIEVVFNIILGVIGFYIFRLSASASWRMAKAKHGF